MPTVPINGFDLSYELAGEGTPAVYIHGGHASLASTLHNPAWYAWSWECGFAARFRFITYDRRGCHRSSCPPAGYDLPNQARDLELLLDHLEVRAAHVIGSSAGGPIALLFAATRPARVRSLILQGTALELFPRGDPVSDLIRRHIPLLEDEGPEAAFDGRPPGVEAWYQSLWAREEAVARGELAAYLAGEGTLAETAAAVPRPRRVLYHTAELLNMRAYVDLDLRPYAARVAAPTLVLHGSADRTVPLAWGEDLARAIPAARLHVVEGGPHGLIQRSAAARQVAIEFMERR